MLLDLPNLALDLWSPPREEQLPKIPRWEFRVGFLPSQSNGKNKETNKGRRTNPESSPVDCLENGFFPGKKMPEFSALEWFCRVPLPLFLLFKLFPKFDPSSETFPIKLSQGTKLRDSKVSSQSFLWNFWDGIPHSQEQLPELRGA